MIVVIFVSARAHMRYLRYSLVIYALGGEFHNVTASAVCATLKDNITVILRYNKNPLQISQQNVCHKNTSRRGPQTVKFVFDIISCITGGPNVR